MTHLRTNQQRLVTLFDVHKSLEQLLSMQYGETYRPLSLSPRGQSLFTEIPKTRTCFQASVEPHWCVCIRWTPVANTGLDWPENVDAMGRFIMEDVNEKIAILRRLKTGHPKSCSLMTSYKVIK